jgi:hypothetical protein
MAGVTQANQRLRRTDAKRVGRGRYCLGSAAAQTPWLRALIPQLPRRAAPRTELLSRPKWQTRQRVLQSFLGFGELGAEMASSHQTAHSSTTLCLPIDFCQTVLDTPERGATSVRIAKTLSTRHESVKLRVDLASSASSEAKSLGH